MDYRIFHVPAIIRMRAYTHGGWAHRQRVSATFLTRTKMWLIFLVLLTGFEPRGSFDLESDAPPIEPPVTPASAVPHCGNTAREQLVLKGKMSRNWSSRKDSNPRPRGPSAYGTRRVSDLPTRPYQRTLSGCVAEERMISIRFAWR